MAFFSVIIPCYNAGITIFETLKSLEDQTYKDFEVVCVNDGSTDNTVAIICEFKENSSMTINIISQQNKGVSVARNKGISMATGEYLVFLDADDCYHPKFLESMYNSLIMYDSDTAYCELCHSRENIKWDTNILIDCSVEEEKSFLEKALYRMDKYGFCCYAYKSKIIKKLNLEFPLNIYYGEDREFIWKYLAHCKKAIAINNTLYWYRDNPLSAVNTASWRRTDALISVEKTSDYLKKLGHPYADKYYEYMYARNMLAVMFNFAKARRKDLFVKLRETYDVRTQMKYLKRITNQKHAKYAAVVYLFSPFLFYLIVSNLRFLRKLRLV